AEDGIRDRNVTGVQTCALPIWQEDAERDQAMPDSLRCPEAACDENRHNSSRVASIQRATLFDAADGVPSEPKSSSRSCAIRKERSEERRVGKECGSRRALADEK